MNDKDTLEALKGYYEELKKTGKSDIDSVKSLIDEQITDFRKSFKMLNSFIDGIDSTETEKESLKKWLLTKKYNSWTVKAHKNYSESYTTINSFFPTGYNGIIELEPQTLCTIPARTGHGKTAVMINLMLDAIEQRFNALKEDPTATKAPVIFLSLEMTAEQIGKRIISNRMRAIFNQAKEQGLIQGNLPTNADKINLYDFMTAQDKLNAPKGNQDHADRVEQLEKRLRKNYEKIRTLTDDNGNSTLNALIFAYNEALKRLEAYEEQGLFILTDTESVSRNINGEFVIDGNGNDTQTKDGVKDFLNNFQNSIVFVDYLQLMETSKNYSDSWQSIKSICNELKEIAQRNNQIIITGAQFNREKFTKDFAYPQELELSKMREGADIEHISNTVFAVAKAPNKQNVIKYYWKILKRRDGENNYESFFYDDDLMYCTLKSTAENAAGLTAPRKEQTEQKGKAEKPTTYPQPTDTTPDGLKKFFTIQINIFFKNKFGAKSDQQKKYASRMLEPCLKSWDQYKDTEKAIEEAYETVQEKIIL